MSRWYPVRTCTDMRINMYETSGSIGYLSKAADDRLEDASGQSGGIALSQTLYQCPSRLVCNGDSTLTQDHRPFIRLADAHLLNLPICCTAYWQSICNGSTPRWATVPFIPNPK